MAIVVEIKKERLEYYLDCLMVGKPIEPPDGEWNDQDMITLAGVCFFVLWSHCSEKTRDVKDSGILREHEEAIAETWRKDIHVAIEWASDSAKLVHAGCYDDEFDLTHEVKLDGEDWSALPLKGFRSE